MGKKKKDNSQIVYAKIWQLKQVEQPRTVRVVMVKDGPKPKPITVRVVVWK